MKHFIIYAIVLSVLVSCQSSDSKPVVIVKVHNSENPISCNDYVSGYVTINQLNSKSSYRNKFYLADREMKNQDDTAYFRFKFPCSNSNKRIDKKVMGYIVSENILEGIIDTSRYGVEFSLINPN